MRFAIQCPALHTTGAYAIQARHIAHRLAADGHDVAIFAYYGHRGGILHIDGFPHYPPGQLEYNADVLPGHIAHWQPDVLITLHDLLVIDPDMVRAIRAAGVQVLHYMPVDCEPLGLVDELILRRGGGTPVAMSRFGERMLTAAGLAPLYAPHCADTALFRPVTGEARLAARKAAGIGPGTFVVAVNAMNKDSLRKGFFEAFEAFAGFIRTHPDSRLLLHSELDSGNWDHGEFIRLNGLEKHVIISEDYRIKTGQFDDRYIAGWYQLADVYLCASWAEGFGVPLIEAQACGLPVIGTDCSAVTELVQPGTGWRVAGEHKPHVVQRRRWKAPLIADLTRALGKAHAAWKGPAWGVRQGKAREFAVRYDADLVFEQFWRPILERLVAGEFRAEVQDAD